MWFGFGMMWLAIGAAVSAGLYFTHNANCLWGLIFGTFISFSTKKCSCKKEKAPGS